MASFLALAVNRPQSFPLNSAPTESLSERAGSRDRVCDAKVEGLGANTGPAHFGGSTGAAPGCRSSPRVPPCPPPAAMELTAERVGNRELLLAGADRNGALLRPRALLPLGSPLLDHELQLLQPFLRARDELGPPDLQSFLNGAKKVVYF